MYKAQEWGEDVALPYVLKYKIAFIVGTLLSCCLFCCLRSRSQRLAVEAEQMQRKQQTQYKMKQMVKEKFSKNEGEDKKGPAKRKGNGTGKRRSVNNASASDSAKEAAEAEEEERAKLITDMQDGVGLSAKPLTSSIFKSSSGLTTVRIQMDVPFKRKDVFRELISKKCPIDIDEEKMASIEAIRPGCDRTKPTTSPGYVRKTVYKNKMTTLHELVECVEPRLLKWRILDAQRIPFKLKGKKRAPECTIELTSDGVGTQCEISYVFEHAEIMFPCCCLAPLTPSAIRFLLVRSLQRVWTDLMLDRGYEVSISLHISPRPRAAVRPPAASPQASPHDRCLPVRSSPPLHGASAAALSPQILAHALTSCLFHLRLCCAPLRARLSSSWLRPAIPAPLWPQLLTPAPLLPISCPLTLAGSLRADVNALTSVDQRHGRAAQPPQKGQGQRA